MAINDVRIVFADAITGEAYASIRPSTISWTEKMFEPGDWTATCSVESLPGSLLSRKTNFSSGATDAEFWTRIGEYTSQVFIIVNRREAGSGDQQSWCAFAGWLIDISESYTGGVTFMGQGAAWILQKSILTSAYAVTTNRQKHFRDLYNASIRPDNYPNARNAFGEWDDNGSSLTIDYKVDDHKIVYDALEFCQQVGSTYRMVVGEKLGGNYSPDEIIAGTVPQVRPVPQTNFGTVIDDISFTYPGTIKTWNFYTSYADQLTKLRMVGENKKVYSDSTPPAGAYPHLQGVLVYPEVKNSSQFSEGVLANEAAARSLPQRSLEIEFNPTDPNLDFLRWYPGDHTGVFLPRWDDYKSFRVVSRTIDVNCSDESATFSGKAVLEDSVKWGIEA